MQVWLLKSYLTEDKELIILHSQYWWPGDTRIHGISSQDIILVLFLAYFTTAAPGWGVKTYFMNRPHGPCLNSTWLGDTTWWHRTGSPLAQLMQSSNKIWNLPDRSTILPKFIYNKEGNFPDRPKFCRSGSTVQHLFWRLLMACCSTSPSYYGNTRTNVDLPSVRSHGILLRALSKEDLKLPITKIELLKSHGDLLRANQLTHWDPVMPYGDRDLGQHWLR